MYSLHIVSLIQVFQSHNMREYRGLLYYSPSLFINILTHFFKIKRLVAVT